MEGRTTNTVVISLDATGSGSDQEQIRSLADQLDQDPARPGQSAEQLRELAEKLEEDSAEARSDKGHTSACAENLANSSDFQLVQNVIRFSEWQPNALVLKLDAGAEDSSDQQIEGKDAEKLQDIPPAKKHAPLRYIALDIYRRLFSIVFLANFVVFVVIMSTDRTVVGLLDAVSANITIASLARLQPAVNVLFRTFSSIPRSAPLRIRHICCNIYHHGGVHSGCGVAATLWYIGFVAVLTHQIAAATNSTPAIMCAILSLAYIILILLICMLVAAFPKIRLKRHDSFEFTHRFCGWSVIVLFWIVVLLFASQQQPSMGGFLVSWPTFWFLIITTCSIIYPWALLRKVRVDAEVLSDHAVRLHFSYRDVTYGEALSIAKHPLRDWHSFAGLADCWDNSSTKFSLLVSKAGDWTTDAIQNPLTYVWKRGIPMCGVAHSMHVFTRLIVVATGSGIGPCLSFLGDHSRPAMRVVWQTRNPNETYGRKVVALVEKLDPIPVILDSDESGRFDMLPIVVKLYRDFRAEAVCVISNPKQTRELVFNLQSRGIPAYGPIFDS